MLKYQQIQYNAYVKCFKENLRYVPSQEKNLQKSSIIKLGDLYNTGLQFPKTLQVPEKWVNYSDNYYPAEHEY